MRKSKARGFSLIELIIVIAIVGLLATMAIPEMDKAIDRSKSVACMGSLRQIGVAVTSYVSDNNGKYPSIETNPDNPVYPEGVEAKPIWEELEAYGISKQVLKCPSDKTYINTKGSSYQWRPIIDDELSINPMIYGRRGFAFSVDPSRVTICSDYDAWHFNRGNRLKGDGSVSFRLK